MSDKSNQVHVTPASAESSPDKQVRGDFQSPHTAQGPALTYLTRVLTVKLDPKPEQWRRLRDLAWQAMRYKNQFMRAKWAHDIKLRAPENSARGTNVETHIRQDHYELSAAAYVAAEADVKGAWQRDYKKIRAGAPLSQWRHSSSLGIHGHRERAKSGVRVVYLDGHFHADLSVQSKDCEGGCWMRMPMSKGTEIDDYQAPLLRDMATGLIAVRRSVLQFNFERGRLSLRMAYRLGVAVPAMGARVATLGPVMKNGRLALRTELVTREYAAKLNTVRQHKMDWDLIRRRTYGRIGRGKGSARAKRRKLSAHTFDDWCKTYLHQWSRDIIDWCHSQGVGRLVVLDLAGGDWPAHQFGEFLKYKAEQAGITADGHASLNDTGTERAAKNEVKQQQRKAKRYGDAVRTITHEVQQA